MKEATKKEQIGIVYKDKENKTIVVEIETKVKHLLYNKVVKRRKRFHVHDEKNEAHVGDKVRIVETRPLSKLKNWKLVEVIERGELIVK